MVTIGRFTQCIKLGRDGNQTRQWKTIDHGSISRSRFLDKTKNRSWIWTAMERILIFTIFPTLTTPTLLVVGVYFQNVIVSVIITDQVWMELLISLQDARHIIYRERKNCNARTIRMSFKESLNLACSGSRIGKCL